MNEVLRSMLSKYRCETVNDYNNALREIMQEMALLGLWRAKFFEHAAFYGGTALRVLYGLDRFSEDLDFSLLKPDHKFNINDYCSAVKMEMESFGLTVSVDKKSKSHESDIESAFIKAGTIRNLISIDVPAKLTDKINKNSVYKIKLEVDKNPPAGFETEAKYLFQPIPFSVLTYKQPYLFAGKIHAVLCRPWKSRMRGRDWYDLIWFVSNNVPVSLKHLESRLKQTGHMEPKQKLQGDDLKEMLNKKIEEINVAELKKDVSIFLKDQRTINAWSKDLFKEAVVRIMFE